MKAQTRSLKYCPCCGSKVKAIFDTVEAGEPYPVGVQAGKYECPDCKAITYFLPKRFRQHRVAPEFKEGDYLPIMWPGFTRPERRGRGVKDQERPSAKQLNYAHNLAEELHIEDNYNWQEMTREEISDLIDELKDRLGLK